MAARIPQAVFPSVDIGLPSTGILDARRCVSSIALTFLGLHMVTWSILPTFVATSINRDTAQILYWGRELEWGYFKHPPLLSWLTEATTSVFGRNDLVVYATGEGLMVIAFIATFCLARRYLSPLLSVLAVAVLPVMGYYSYLVPHLNHNIITIPFWAVTLLLAYRAIEERRPRAWLWLGVVIGFGILGKYTILVLPALIFAYLLMSPAHRPLFRLRELWLGVALCLLIILPHLVWLAQSGFPTLHYLAADAGVGSSLLSHIVNPVDGFLKMAGMCAPLLLALAAGLGVPRLETRALGSRDRFLVFMTLGPAVLVLVLSLITGGEFHNEWAAPFFVTLPILLLRFYAEPTARQLNRFLTWVSGLSLAMIAVFLAIYSGLLPLAAEAPWARFPAGELAGGVAEGWERVCPGPVPVVIGDSWLAGTASYRLPGRPQVYTEADPAMAPWASDRAIRETGAVIVWEADQAGRFREVDHLDTPAPGQPDDWFPGIPALEARFGTVVRLPDLVLTYPAVTGLPPIILGRALVPPATQCPEQLAKGRQAPQA